MAAAEAVAYDVRWRAVGSESVWKERRFPVGPGIRLGEVSRGVTYEVQVCSVAENGQTSDWVAHTVTVPDTNRLGALALPTNVIGNRASMWNVDTSVTYAAATPESGQGTATVSVSAGTLVVGGSTILYGASSASISGAPGTSRTIYLYYDDPRMEGGSRPLGIADNIVESANADGRVAITALTIAFPAPGGTGSGGGGIGGGGGGGGANPRENQVIQ